MVAKRRVFVELHVFGGCDVGLLPNGRADRAAALHVANRILVVGGSGPAIGYLAFCIRQVTSQFVQFNRP